MRTRARPPTRNAVEYGPLIATRTHCPLGGPSPRSAVKLSHIHSSSAIGMARDALEQARARRPRPGAGRGLYPAGLGDGPGPALGLAQAPGGVMRPSEGCGGQSVGGEVLVVAGRVLAGPLVELLAGAAAGAVDAQAQAAAGIPELPVTVGLLHREPLAAGRPVHRLLHDVRRPGGGGIARYGEVVAGVLRLQLAVAARGGHELELLLGLAVAGPLVDRRARRAGVPGHVQAQPVVTDRHVVASAGDSAAARLGRCRVDGERVV